MKKPAKKMSLISKVVVIAAVAVIVISIWSLVEFFT